MGFKSVFNKNYFLATVVAVFCFGILNSPSIEARPQKIVSE